jgi:serine/threonine-protein kinase
MGITVDTAGTLYVTNIVQNNVAEYKAGQSVPYRTISDGLNGPVDATVNAKGRLYVTNIVNATVVEFAPGSWKPSDREITNGLDNPNGSTYFPPSLL